MATNFPDTSIDNPFVTPPRPWINGDEFDDTTESGLIYYWNDPVWKTKAGDITVPSLNGGPLAGFRNQIINGDFRIWQRGQDFDMTTLSGKSYTADRWYVASSGGIVGRSSGANPAPSGANGFSLTFSGGTDPSLRQGIEVSPNNCGPFVPNSQWTLSWYSTSSTTGATVGFKSGDITAQPLVADRLLDNTQGDSLGTNRYSATFTIPAGAVPAGTTMFFVMLLMSPGETISEIQLEPGPVATPFEHHPYGTELALCQRYFYSDMVVSAGIIYSSSFPMVTVPLPTTMRAIPNVSVSYAYAFTSKDVNGSYPQLNYTATTVDSIPSRSNIRFELKGGTWAPYQPISGGGVLANVTYTADAEL